MTAETLEAPVHESRLYPAAGTSRPLPRPALDSSSEVLDGAYPVVVLAAPAGYGKSTLMAQWHGRLCERRVACAWLSLDEDDNDKVRFVQHLVAAIRTVQARVGGSALAQVAGDFTGGAKPLLEAIADDLARVHGRLVLFLDDLQFIRQPEVVEIVDWLANYAPRNIQFVIGSREEPGIRVAGLRVRRQLFEIGIKRMQFGLEEASMFYRSRLGRDLPARDLQQLMSKTEGWPAALELAAMALDGVSDQAGMIEQFAGTDTSVVDYLGEVILSRVDERTRSFVSRISQFDRISAPLARAIARDDDVEALLGTLRSRHLFLIPLDRSGTWARFHHLVGEFFRERYRRVAPAEARACLVLGAAWLHDNGHIEDAINCAIRARDWETATRWVADNVEELAFRRGYHQTVLRWMNALPGEWVDRYPVIRIQYAFSLSFYPRRQEYEAQVHRLERLLRRMEADPGSDAKLVEELRCAVELQDAMSLALRDEGRRGGERAAAWLQRWPEAPLQHKGVMGNVLAFGHKSSGAIGDGLDVVGQTRRWLEQGEGHYALAWTAYVEAVLHLKRGTYLEARRACLNGLEQVDSKLHGHPAHASLLHTLLAGIAYEFDEIDSASEHIERAMTSVDEYGPADAVIVAYLTRSRLQLLRQDPDGARAILREGQELGERRGLPRVTVTLAAEECTCLGRAGQFEEARIVAARFGFDELPSQDGASSLGRDKAFRASSRFVLRQAPQLVAQALGGAIERSRQKGLFHRSAELLLLRALAHDHEGERGLASEDLLKALTIASPRGYLRLFLDDARVLRPLLDRLGPDQTRGTEAAPLARRLQQLMRDANARAIEPGDDVGTAAEELTKREVAILKRLESGMSNREIAESIFISEGTLKWHLHNIYGKLDVKNRAGAMVRARGLGILAG
ncbi:LuxR C-terminal-related transcriptional regulator [Scleromatobacter humisilvae]|uniref:LuxR C-terminal-related transcriptional regulator n=1 Tax=Scleromatobacter humisilvae TaxID=2897159 RepID=UPI0023D94754|nr:LuxR C-terminal-related transcriptional regulator [Scleromatobacter humisilvae]